MKILIRKLIIVFFQQNNGLNRNPLITSNTINGNNSMPSTSLPGSRGVTKPWSTVNDTVVLNPGLNSFGFIFLLIFVFFFHL